MQHLPTRVLIQALACSVTDWRDTQGHIERNLGCQRAGNEGQRARVGAAFVRPCAPLISFFRTATPALPRAYAAPTLHLRCTYAAPTLHLRCTYAAHTLRSLHPRLRLRCA